MKILVLNCGSSSIKYQLIDMANNAEVMAKGLLERIGLEMGEFTHKYHGEKHYEQLPIPDHTAGIKIVLNAPLLRLVDVVKGLHAFTAFNVHNGPFDVLHAHLLSILLQHSPVLLGAFRVLL